jgi:hypothetical protein
MRTKNLKASTMKMLTENDIVLFPKRKKINSKKYRFDNDSIDDDNEEINNDLITDFSYRDENEDKDEFGGRTKYQSVWRNGNILNSGLRYI